MVVPVDERILVDQTLVDELFGTRESEFAIAPCSVRENNGRKTPVVAKLFETDLAPQFYGWNKPNVRFFQAGIDQPVFLFALFDMPAGQAVLYFAVWPFVLLENRDFDPAIRKDFGCYRPSDSTSDDSDEVLRV